jgi:hypothetical protein
MSTATVTAKSNMSKKVKTQVNPPASAERSLLTDVR